MCCVQTSPKLSFAGSPVNAIWSGMLTAYSTHTNLVVHHYTWSMGFRSHPAPCCSVGSDVRQINFGFSVWRQDKYGIGLQKHVRLCLMKLVKDVIWSAQNAYVETTLAYSANCHSSCSMR